MAQQPVQLEDNIFSIKGGFLGQKELVVKAEKDANDRSFTTIDRTTSRFKLFLGGNYAMMDRMIKLRNAAVDARMADCDKEANDPLHDAAPAGAVGLQRKRKEVFDDLEAETIEIAPVSDGGDVHTVLVRPHWYKRAKLSIEVTRANFELLLKKPHDLEDSFRPVITAEGVTWNKSRSCVWLAWFDGVESHTKSFKVSFGEGWSHAEKQAEVDSKVQDLLVWYDTYKKDVVVDGGDNEGALDPDDGHKDALIASQEDNE